MRESQQLSALYLLQKYSMIYSLFFNIVSLLCNALRPAVHKLGIPAEKKIFGWLQSHWCTTSCTSLSEENRWPCKASFSGPNKWKSDRARSGLRWMFQHLETQFVDGFKGESSGDVRVGVIVQQQHFPWQKTSSFAANCWFKFVSQQCTVIIFVDGFPLHVIFSIGPFASQNMVSITFPADAAVLNFSSQVIWGVSTLYCGVLILAHSDEPMFHHRSLFFSKMTHLLCCNDRVSVGISQDVWVCVLQWVVVAPIANKLYGSQVHHG